MTQLTVPLVCASLRVERPVSVLSVTTTGVSRPWGFTCSFRFFRSCSLPSWCVHRVVGRCCQLAGVQGVNFSSNESPPCHWWPTHKNWIEGESFFRVYYQLKKVFFVLVSYCPLPCHSVGSEQHSFLCFFHMFPLWSSDPRSAVIWQIRTCPKPWHDGVTSGRLLPVPGVSFCAHRNFPNWKRQLSVRSNTQS